MPSVYWADIPRLSAWDAPCPAAWLQCWLQSRRPGADPRPSGHRLCPEVLSMRTGFPRQDARDDFDRARRRAFLAKLAGWLRGRPSSWNRLPVLGEVTTLTSASAGGSGTRRLEYEHVGRLGPTHQEMARLD